MKQIKNNKKYKAQFYLLPSIFLCHLHLKNPDRFAEALGIEAIKLPFAGEFSQNGFTLSPCSLLSACQHHQTGCSLGSCEAVQCLKNIIAIAYFPLSHIPFHFYRILELSTSDSYQFAKHERDGDRQSSSQVRQSTKRSSFGHRWEYQSLGRAGWDFEWKNQEKKVSRCRCTFLLASTSVPQNFVFRLFTPEKEMLP